MNEASGFDGLRVAIFESRMAGTLASLVEKHGGIAIPAPSMREVPIEDNAEAIAFLDQLLAGRFDLVIFETGVGIRMLVQALEARFPASGWGEALAGSKIVARGPKPVAVLRELGVRIDLKVPEPNTWRETLATLDAEQPVKGLRVAVQEYGKPVPELIEGLENRGASVTRVPVYRWALPEDTGPLAEALARMAEGQIDAALFTSAQQVEHVLQVAASSGIEAPLREAMTERVVVGSVGPTTSAALRAHGLPVDIEPEHPKSGHLVAAVASEWRRIGKVRR